MTLQSWVWSQEKLRGQGFQKFKEIKELGYGLNAMAHQIHDEGI